MIARSETGKIIASGEFSQVVQGDEVTMRLTYKFLDGSLDDETTTYRQQDTFRLVRNHHIQQGPFFAKPVDFTVEAATGIATSRTADKNGKIHVESEHIDLPDDSGEWVRWNVAAECAAQYDAVSGGDAGASRRRAIDSDPDLAGGRAAVSNDRTDP